MKTNYPVHPLADIFPMMPEDELAALADDIKANGLVHPIMLDKDGEQLVDGRNRLKACKLAEVEPRFERLNGQDPAAYIVSVNLERRNMNKGQRAIALAMIYPDSDKGGRGKKSEAKTAAKRGGFSGDRLERARMILAHSRKLAEAVLAGTTHFDAALAKVEAEQRAAQTDEAKLARLRAEAPDLADLVADERMKIGEAIAALDQRIETANREQRTATEVLHGLFDVLFPRGASPAKWAEQLTRDVNAKFWPRSAAADLTGKSLRACAEVMRAIAEREIREE